VPGGRIRKEEKIKNALSRILLEELGYVVDESKIKSIKEIGSYEHFYKDNFLGNRNFSTHYIVLAFLIPYEILIEKVKKNMINNEQHSEYIWQSIIEYEESKSKIHQNTLDYFDNKFIKIFLENLSDFR